MIKELESKKKKIAIIGLGYVGLPIALEFAKKFSVIGFDINEARIKMMQQKIDPSEELTSKDFEGCDIVFTNKLEVLKKASFFIVAVPTPIDSHNRPDLRPLIGASTSVGKVLKKGDYVVFESTVYPGCTEDDCIPILEKESGLKFKKDFKVGYSPERINPGDKEHTLTKILKIVSGCDKESLDIIADVYGSIVTAGIHKAPTIKVAESAKIIENTQRDLNIALMNELSIIFNKMGINTYDVLEAAGTKWNFLKFSPGLVGGHCIGVDPYYLTHKASEIGYHSKVILAGRYTNDGVGSHIAKEVIRQMIVNEIPLKKAKVLVMGATFKENVADIRNSKVVDIINELKTYHLNIEVVDPRASAEDIHHEYGFKLAKKIGKDYDAIIVAVSHNEYQNLSDSYFKGISKKNAVFFDVKGMYKNKIRSLTYMSL